MPAFAASAMAARFDLISKALSTSVTGEQNRKSIKNLETIVVDNLRFCMKGNNIIQYTYGEDNLDPRYVERIKLPTVMLGDKELKEKYKYNGEITSEVNPPPPALRWLKGNLIRGKNQFPSGIELIEKLTEDEYDLIKKDRDEYREIFLNFEALNLTHLLDDSVFVPFNLPRIIGDTLNRFGERKPNNEEIIEMMTMVREFIGKLPYIMFNEHQEKIKFKIPEFLSFISFIPAMMIRIYLCSNELKKMDKKILKFILDKSRTKYQSCLIEYGTAVGIIAAQSFSEPLTQYMLDAQHHATAGGTSKSEMTRAKEVLGVRPTEKMHAPLMFLEVVEEARYDKMKVKEIANNIEVITLRRFAIYWQIFY